MTLINYWQENRHMCNCLLDINLPSFTLQYTFWNALGFYFATVLWNNFIDFEFVGVVPLMTCWLVNTMWGDPDPHSWYSCSKRTIVFFWQGGFSQTPGTYKVICGPTLGQYFPRFLLFKKAIPFFQPKTEKSWWSYAQLFFHKIPKKTFLLDFMIDNRCHFLY